MRGVKKKKQEKKIIIIFLFKLYLLNLPYIFNFFNSLYFFFYMPVYNFFLSRVYIFFKLSKNIDKLLFKKKTLKQFFKKKKFYLFRVLKKKTSERLKIFLKVYASKLPVSFFKSKLLPFQRTKHNFFDRYQISLYNANYKSVYIPSNNCTFDMQITKYIFMYSYIGFKKIYQPLVSYSFLMYCNFIYLFYKNNFVFFSSKLINLSLCFFAVFKYITNFHFMKLIDFSLFFKKKFLFSECVCADFAEEREPKQIQVLSILSEIASPLRIQLQVFFKKFFNLFKYNFFTFVFFGIKYNNNNNVTQKLLSSLLFLPDKFLLLNYSGFFIRKYMGICKYSNITPLLNIPMKIRFPKKKNTPIKNHNIFLWYLLNFFENKLGKPMSITILYSRKSIAFYSVYQFCIKVFRKFKRYNFRFKRNFFLGEIIRIVLVSLLSRDATLFLNWVKWVLMQIPYKNLKGFLYFLKILLKKHLLPKFKKMFALKGFIFDIRGKVGVTGDAKKRHTLISWGQSSFSEKNLKLSLKQGLVFTKTGVMGVTVIIIF